MLDPVLLPIGGWVMPICGDCRKRRERETRLANLVDRAHAAKNLPANLREVRFSSLRGRLGNQQACKVAWDFCRRDPPTGWLQIEGQPGVGKTFLMAAVVNEFADRGVPVVYARTDDVIAVWHSAHDYDAERRMEARHEIERLRKVRVLCLDELGLYPGSDKALRFLDQIVDERYAEGLPLIVATNLIGEEMDRYSLRLADRLADRTVCQTVEMAGSSWRRMSSVQIAKYSIWKAH